MKIGSRPNVQRERGYANVNVTARDFGAGVGAALQNLGGAIDDYGMSKTQLAGALAEKKKKNERAKLDIRLTRWQGEEKRRIMDETLNVAPGAEGFTNGVYTSVEQSWESFKKSQQIPPELEAEYEERFEVFRQNAATTAFATELEESDRLIVEMTNEQLDVMAQDVHVNNQNFSLHFDQISEVIEESGLPPTKKEEMKQVAYNRLSASLFESERIQAQNEQLPVREPDGSDVVAPGLAPWERGLLNAITAFEAPGGAYNVRFNGRGGAPAYFEDYNDHPRVFVPTGRKKADGSDEVSSAAGRYQFTATTWDYAMRTMQAQGYEMDGTFSPVNQDRAAIWLAGQDFQRRTGRSLASVVQSGDREQLRQVWEGLKGTWEGLQEGFGGNFDKFANIILGSKGLQGGGTGSSQVPDVWQDPRYATLTYDQKIQLDSQAHQTADAQREARKKQLELEQQTVYDNLLKAFALGEPNALDAADAMIASGRVSDADKITKLMDLSETEREERKQVMDVLGRITTGQVMGPDEEDDLNVYARRSGLVDGMTSQDPNAYTEVQAIFDKTGAIPTDVLSALERMQSHPDPSQRMFAVQALAELYQRNPDSALRNMSEKQANNAALAATISQYSPDPQSALDFIQTLTKPENAELRKRLTTLAEESIEEADVNDFFERATTFTQRNLMSFAGMPNAQMPADPSQNMLFTSDYERLYKANFVMMQGDEDAAHDATGKMMAYQWQPNPINGELMKNSPLSPKFGLRPINGSYDWIGQKAREDAGLAPDDDFTVVSDAQTMRDFNETGVPSYAVLAIKDGMFVPSTITRTSLKPTEAMQAENERSIRLEQLENSKSALAQQFAKANNFFGLLSNPEQVESLKQQMGQIDRQIESLQIETRGALPPSETDSGATQQDLVNELNSLNRVSTPEARQRMQQIQQELQRRSAE